jgi:hypothetical protein
MSFRLLVETPAPNEQFEYVLEEKNSKGPANLYIKGPYMMAEGVNKNNRIYDLNEMAKEVGRYTEEFIKTNRAMGELNHPTAADVNLERACHLVTELRQEGNVFFGKSKVLTTPMGMIVRSLINDGVKVGMSSRALGKLEEQNNGINRVTEMRLVAIDCVADPSFSKAFVNGILESKEFVISQDGRYEEIYGSLSRSLNNLPKKDLESYLKEQISNFFKKFTLVG